MYVAPPLQASRLDLWGDDPFNLDQDVEEWGDIQLFEFEDTKTKHHEPIDILPSDWTEESIIIPVDGKPAPFRFEPGRAYLRTIYDILCERVLLLFGRQSEKSSYLGHSILAKMALNSNFTALYVSPTQDQTRTFRRDKIADRISLSPWYKQFVNDTVANNISLLRFINASQLLLRYAFLTADRIRGISTDLLAVDEIQDILSANLPVIEECASHGNKLLRMFLYAGTPKTFDNTIEFLWSRRSTQNEWAVPCEKCGTSSGTHSSYYWNAPLDEGNIGKKGLICKRCKGPIFAAHEKAQWVSMMDSARNIPEFYESFRVPQIMVPWLDWSKILGKYETYEKGMFYNEVLAISSDTGTRPLRTEDLIQTSSNDLPMNLDIQQMAEDLRPHPLFFGIDWAGEARAYTVLTIGSYLSGISSADRFNILYFRRFIGPEADPDMQFEVLSNLINLFRPKFVGVDFGGGREINARLINRFGPQLIHRYQYIGGFANTKRPMVQYDPQKGRYMVDRTDVMSAVFTAIRKGKFVFPRWSDWQEPYARDFLSIYSEYSNSTHSIRYDKALDANDDSFHSFLYCFLASNLMYQRSDILYAKLDPTYRSVVAS